MGTDAAREAERDHLRAAPETPTLFAEIARWRNIVLDCEVVVDDCRRAVADHREKWGDDDPAEAERLDALLAEAIQERDRAARRLATLIDEARRGRRSR
jgi:hypothetical protein